MAVVRVLRGRGRAVVVAQVAAVVDRRTPAGDDASGLAGGIVRVRGGRGVRVVVTARATGDTRDLGQNIPVRIVSKQGRVACRVGLRQNAAGVVVGGGDRVADVAGGVVATQPLFWRRADKRGEMFADFRRTMDERGQWGGGVEGSQFEIVILKRFIEFEPAVGGKGETATRIARFF